MNESLKLLRGSREGAPESRQQALRPGSEAISDEELNSSTANAGYVLVQKVSA
jgi:hypothetical protein